MSDQWGGRSTCASCRLSLSLSLLSLLSQLRFASWFCVSPTGKKNFQDSLRSGPEDHRQFRSKLQLFCMQKEEVFKSFRGLFYSPTEIFKCFQIPSSRSLQHTHMVQEIEKRRKFSGSVCRPRDESCVNFCSCLEAACVTFIHPFPRLSLPSFALQILFILNILQPMLS